MSEINSIETRKEIPVRVMVDVGDLIADIDKSAIEDSVIDGRLYNRTSYIREIISQHLRLRDYCRTWDMPRYRPADVTDMIITGEYKRPCVL